MTTRMRAFLVLGAAAALTGCEDPAEPYAHRVGPCDLTQLPLALGTEERVLTDVALEVQIKGIVVKITVQDPDGVAEFASLPQRLEVYQDRACVTRPLSEERLVPAVGQQVTFGTMVRAYNYPDLYQSIAGANSWPVRIVFQDLQGNYVEARVAGRVVETRPY